MTTRIKPVPSDIEIAQAALLTPIRQIAESVGLSIDDLHLYGKYKAKVDLDVLERLQDQPNGKYIVVTAITPTPLVKENNDGYLLNARHGAHRQEGSSLYSSAIYGPHL